MATADEATQPQVLERLERIEALLQQLLSQQPKAQKLLYDVDDLKAEGIKEREAYRILRRYCQPKAGRRLRITYEQLMDYYRSREG